MAPNTINQIQENPTGGNMNELTRYDRQIRIWGEDGQRKLSDSRVTIIGDGNLSKNVLMPLSALGFGEIRVMGDSVSNNGDFFLDMPHVEGYRVDSNARGANTVNPNISIIPIPRKLDDLISTDYLRDSSLIIDTTNDPRSKAIALDYGAKNSINVLSAAVGESFAKMELLRPGQDIELSHVMPNYEGREQDFLVSLFWGGVLAEEAKKLIIGEEEILEKPIFYNMFDPEDKFIPFEEEDIIQRAPRTDYKDKSALVLGAGALGNIMVLGLSDLGFGRVDYIDYDTVESHNLNRQILFYDAVGLEKSTVLAHKHSVMNPDSKARGIVRKLTFENGEYSIQDLQDEQNYDVAFDLVDNVYARALMSGFSVMNSIPLVSAGSSPNAAQISTYSPGRTACKNHVLTNFYEDALQVERARRMSCIDEPDPSVIVTNQVAGALAALETRALFEGDNFERPLSGYLKYDANRDYRLGATIVRNACDCHETKNVPNLEMDIPDLDEEMVVVEK